MSDRQLSPPAVHRGVTHPARILIENSEYWLRNNGDLAMLAVTIGRLRARWPDARIAVLTDTPALLRAYFPQAEGISVFDTDPWAKPSVIEELSGRLGPRVVGPIAVGRLRAKVWLRVLPARARNAPRRLRRMLGRSSATETPSPIPPAGPVAPSRAPHPGSAIAAQEASAVLALGGGYLTDADPRQTVRVLNVLGHACDSGKVVALVGQGLGPLDDPALQARAREVLPRVDFVSLREGRSGPTVLRQADVPPERVMITGDDAIELAYSARSDVMGSDLGICVRVAGYSPVSQRVRARIGQVVRAEAERKDAALVPLIIAEYHSQDRRSTLPLVRGATRVVPPLPRYVHPVEVARRVARCRVVITGAYHLAVFALAQGIPVVALTSSRYYDDKFLGLAEMFGAGLTLVRLDDPSVEQTLSEAVDESWRSATELRDSLRERARAQIAASREAFDRVFALVETGAGEG